jgi:Fe-Mn family superoxide dismutase
MPHEPKNFDHLLGKLKGLSESQLKQHFTLYQGYVKKLNEIEEKLAKQDKSGANYSFNEYSELKRREAVALNGAYLHEMYFENLSADGGEPSPALKKAAEAAFGSWDNAVADIKAAAGSTPGWVLLTWSEVDRRLHTYIMYEHHIGLPVRQKILLALDCWEHAFMVDYGIRKADYLAAFFDNVDWKAVNRRFEAQKA